MFGSKKVSWLLGGTTGIGFALAEKLLKEGHLVLISGRQVDTPEVRRLQAAFRQDCVLESLDVTDRAQCQQVLSRIHDLYGLPDMVMFNAGVYTPMPLADWSHDLFEKSLQVNFMGSINLLDALMPYYREQKRGHLLLTASLAAYRGLPKSAPYSASKAALMSLAECLQPELAALGVKLQLVSPGFVKTRLTDKNDFKMPALMDVNEAADAIYKGLQQNKFEIAFPGRFVVWMKLLRILPYRLYLTITRKML